MYTNTHQKAKMQTSRTGCLGQAKGSLQSVKVFCQAGANGTQPSTTQADYKGVYKGVKLEDGQAALARRKKDQRPSLSAIYPRGSVCAVVLGGGETDSRRLFPLTEKRTLPAIPLAGMYRLIDIPISNLLHSGVNKIFVLTQYNSTSLNRYLQHTYDCGGCAPVGGDAFIEVVAATQGPKEQRWAEGPADNVRQWWSMFSSNSQQRLIEDVLVLPSDQVYNMDFTTMVDFHRSQLADLTIVCRPVEEKLVSHVGCIKLSTGNQIEAFEEKPEGDMKAAMSMDFADVSEFFQEAHLNSVPFLDYNADTRTWIGSTGMYLFRKEALDELLKANPRARDFGRELIPEAIKRGMRVMAYNFPDYWVDIGGSVGEFYDFNMDLAQGKLPFKFDGDMSPFYGSTNNLPPNNYEQVQIKQSLVGSGCRLDHCKIIRSVIGSRSIIGAGCLIEDSIVMGADYYEHEKDWSRQVGPHYPSIGVGQNCTIKKTIVDKNARIGNNVQLINKEGLVESMDRLAQGIAIRDGITIVSKSAIIPDGTVC